MRLRPPALPHPAAILSRDGAQLDSYRFTHGLLAAARRAGVRIYDRTPVTRTRFRARGVELRTAGGARVRARHLVAATGYEADSFLPKGITSLHSTYALVSEPVPALHGWPADRCLIWETADPYVYLRTTSDSRVIIGGYDEDFRDPVARDRLLGAKAGALQRRFRQLFPRIPLEVAYAWAGTFARTDDGLPFIGRHPAVPHTWFALGYGGNGITYSLLAAELIRDRVLGRPNRDEELFGFGRAGAGQRFRARSVTLLVTLSGSHRSSRRLVSCESSSTKDGVATALRRSRHRTTNSYRRTRASGSKQTAQAIASARPSRIIRSMPSWLSPSAAAPASVARRSCGTRASSHFRGQRGEEGEDQAGEAETARPRRQQRPITVVNQSEAAVVTPRTRLPRLRTAAAPMNPMPVGMPS